MDLNLVHFGLDQALSLYFLNNIISANVKVFSLKYKSSKRGLANVESVRPSVQCKLGQEPCSLIKVMWAQRASSRELGCLACREDRILLSL